jgi:predicted aspartyl protease
MRRAYSRSFDPPAPVVSLRLKAPGGTEVRSIDAKIDSGADLCCVPEHLVRALDLPPVRIVRAAGFAGAAREAVVFRVDIEIHGLEFPRAETLAFSRPYALVGRNVLRHVVVRLDGPKAQLDVRRPR